MSRTGRVSLEFGKVFGGNQPSAFAVRERDGIGLGLADTLVFGAELDIGPTHLCVFAFGGLAIDDVPLVEVVFAPLLVHRTIVEACVADFFGARLADARMGAGVAGASCRASGRSVLLRDARLACPAVAVVRIAARAIAVIAPLMWIATVRVASGAVALFRDLVRIATISVSARAVAVVFHVMRIAMVGIASGAVAVVRYVAAIALVRIALLRAALLVRAGEIEVLARGLAPTRAVLRTALLDDFGVGP